jgi:hypothetical protein
MIDILLLTAGLFVALILGFLAYFYVQSKRALRGAFGREQQWAAELMQEDEEFAEAVKELSEDEITVLANVSFTKDELCENVLDYREKKRND